MKRQMNKIIIMLLVSALLFAFFSGLGCSDPEPTPSFMPTHTASVTPSTTACSHTYYKEICTKCDHVRDPYNALLYIIKDRDTDGADEDGAYAISVIDPTTGSDQDYFFQAYAENNCTTLRFVMLNMDYDIGSTTYLSLEVDKHSAYHDVEMIYITDSSNIFATGTINARDVKEDDVYIYDFYCDASSTSLKYAVRDLMSVTVELLLSGEQLFFLSDLDVDISLGALGYTAFE